MIRVSISDNNYRKDELTLFKDHSNFECAWHISVQFFIKDRYDFSGKISVFDSNDAGQTIHAKSFERPGIGQCLSSLN